MLQSTIKQFCQSYLGCVSVVGLVLLGACSANKTGQRPGSRVSGAAGSAADAPVMGVAPECSADNPFCGKMADDPTILQPAMTLPANTQTMRADCGELPMDITPAGVNIMIAVDGAHSMATHWENIQKAVRDLRSGNPSANFGIQIFWGNLIDNFEDIVAQTNICQEAKNRVLDVGAHDAAELVAFLGDGPPGDAAPGGFFEISPVVEPLNYFVANATTLADPTRTNYLVFITSGNDNCFGSVWATDEDRFYAYQKLAVEIHKRNINIVPVGFDAAGMPDSTGQWGTVKPNTDLKVLQTLLDYGGKALKDVPRVDNPAKLAEVIKTVGQSVLSCRFDTPATADPNSGVNPFQLALSLNGVDVPRDRTGTNGWNFVNGKTSQIDLFGQACNAARSGVKLAARKTCNADVCGTSVVKVETKPRAVLLLLDESASRLECVDGSQDTCITPPMAEGRTPTFADEVLHAVALSLTAPINDDVEFGLQFFPGKMASALACDVAQQPEIPPADGTEITIMKQMLQKLPLGRSPVVGVLENVAATPGRLAEPGVLGAVVMLSDGGDNCSLPDNFDPADQAMADAAQNAMVASLGSATAKLLSQGVRTFAVRYGSEAGRTPQGDEQLAAIVEHGGTAVVDPTDPTRKPYIDAKNKQELAAALADISDRLATCAFEISGVPDAANKDNANLYLNGDGVPFDKDATMADGWNWTDATRNGIQLFGPACEAFKNNRHTSIVVEFGCPPEKVISPD